MTDKRFGTYELWEVKKVRNRWREKRLHRRYYLNDVKSFAAKELGVMEWTHDTDKDFHHNVDDQHYYTIEFNRRGQERTE